MTNFLDGPAMGQVLLLRRSPLFLRVVQAQGGEWDALDQLDDTPKPREKLFVYRLVKTEGRIHICRRGGRGGMYSRALYTLHDTQPADETLRLTRMWRDWCADEYDRLLAQAKEESA